MLDVAAVASRMLTGTLPVALRHRLLAPFGRDSDGLNRLLYLVALHDIGKATPAFQEKVAWAKRLFPTLGFDLEADRGSRNHSDIGLYLLDGVLSAQGADSGSATQFARAVCAHHGQFPTDRVGLNQPGSREGGRKPAWDRARSGIVTALTDLFRVHSLPGLTAVDHAYFALLAGMTSVADWIGSMEDVFRYEPPQDSPAAYWELALERADRALSLVGMRRLTDSPGRSFRGLFPDYTPWPLHEAADAIASTLTHPALVIVEAPMGEGKTEAALVLADAASVRLNQHGFYIGLPTQATANNMFRRVESFLERTRPGQPSTLVLAHAEAQLVESYGRLRMRGVYDEDPVAITTRDAAAAEAGWVRAESWFQSRKRALLAEFGVGTIDQALHAVMRVPHGFVRIHALAGKVVILDEVHAYDTYTGTLLDRLLEWLAATGTTVLLLSATLPSARRAQLLQAYRKGARLSAGEAADAPYPRVSIASASSTTVRHVQPRGNSQTLLVRHAPDDMDSLSRLVADQVRAGGCVGWICNTVQRAQDATVAARSLMPELRDRLLLLHSRFFPEDRQARERVLARWLGPEGVDCVRPESALVVGTQVLEQSLDIDFDLLVTDIAPVDLVLQRAGRLWRHARQNRSPAHREPVILLACPSGNAATASLDAAAKVYAPLLVRRTMQILQGRDAITIPDDIEPLVNQVYSDRAVPSDEELYGDYLKYHGGKASARNEAEQKLMPHPDVRDDPFGDFRVYLNDADDPVLHQQLRADTRLGPPSIDVVCLERDGARVFAGGDRLVDLAAVPDWQLTRLLVERSIGVSHRGVVPHLRNTREAMPEGWRTSPVLRHRRVLVFESGQVTVGKYRLRLDPELGLQVLSVSGADD